MDDGARVGGDGASDNATVSARGLSKHYRLGERARLGNALARVFVDLHAARPGRDRR